MKVTYHMPENMTITVIFNNKFKCTIKNINFSDIQGVVEREMREHSFQTAFVIDDSTNKLIITIRKDE